MNAEVMDLEQLASYLQRDLREVSRLASRGFLPGRKVGGEWRFHRAEIVHWVESQMHAYTEEELASLEGQTSGEQDLIVGTLLSEACISVPLMARTKNSVLRDLVTAAEQSWQVYDAETILAALKQREELSSTALESGIAFPHLHRPLPNALGETVIAYGRTVSAIPFGGPRGALTDIYFLVLSRDDKTHLRALARLSRMMLRPGLIDDLRDAESAPETFALLEAAERELLGIE